METLNLGGWAEAAGSPEKRKWCSMRVGREKGRCSSQMGGVNPVTATFANISASWRTGKGAAVLSSAAVSFLHTEAAKPEG